MSLPNSLSSETLHATGSTPPPPHVHEPEDQWSDAHETLETDDERDLVDDLPHPQDDLTIRPQKVSPSPKSHQIRTPSPPVPSPNTPHDHVPQVPDAASVRSVPIVQVTEPSSPTLPMSARSTNSTFPPTPTSSLTPTGTSSQDRRNRHRSAIDVSSMQCNTISLLVYVDLGSPTSLELLTAYLASSQTSYTAVKMLPSPPATNPLPQNPLLFVIPPQGPPHHFPPDQLHHLHPSPALLSVTLASLFQISLTIYLLLISALHPLVALSSPHTTYCFVMLKASMLSLWCLHQ